MHATVLQADDTKALQAWLQKEGFSARPAFEKWAKPYVSGHWVFTAFRYEPTKGMGKITSKAVRMSFSSDKPFFPYRESTDAEPRQTRTLRSI